MPRLKHQEQRAEGTAVSARTFAAHGTDGLEQLCDALGVSKLFPAKMRTLWRKLYGAGRRPDSAKHHRGFGVRRSLSADEARQVARHRRRIRERVGSHNEDRAAIAGIRVAAQRRHSETVAMEERQLANWQHVKSLYETARKFTATKADAARAAAAGRDVTATFSIEQLRKYRGRISFQPPHFWTIGKDKTVWPEFKKPNGTFVNPNHDLGWGWYRRPATKGAVRMQ